jgi:hypothetical protein
MKNTIKNKKPHKNKMARDMDQDEDNLLGKHEALSTAK